MSIKLSILDRSPTDTDDTPAEAMRNTVRLAKIADELGFHRFWVSEHHGSDILVGSSPEVLIAYLLAQTKRIRVGSGGVMLQHYSPFKVAENFNVLAALAPDRVDLGIGRAPGGLPAATEALQGARSQDVIPLSEKLLELDRFIHRGETSTNAEWRLQPQPLPSIPPPIYLLGAGPSSAELAASSGLAFVYAQFINGDEVIQKLAIDRYRQEFDRTTGKSPSVIIAVSVLVADTDEEAQRAAIELKAYRVNLEDGRYFTINTLAGAELLGKQANQPYTVETRQVSVIHGSGQSVADKLLAIQEKYGVDELILSPALNSYEARLRTYQEIASALLIDRAVSGAKDSK